MFNRLNLSTRYTFLIIMLLIALTLLFFWRITFSGMILARGDVYSYFYPLWDARSLAFRAGHIPLWSPDLFMGVPLLANSQLGTFYPPNWFVTPFDAPAAITLSLLAHTFWALLGVYLLTRRTLSLDRAPALLAGVLFGLGGYLGGQSEHINQLQALSWLPWLFLVTTYKSSVEARYIASLFRQSLLFGICLALQLLAGHPQTVFITLVGLGVFGLAQAFVSRQPSANRRLSLPLTLNIRFLTRLILLLIIGSAVGLLLAAPQLIPTLELAGLGNRGAGLDPQKVLAFSFTPLLLGRGLLPSYDGLLFGEYIAYSGVIGLGLAIIAICNRPSRLAPESHSLSTLPYLLLVIIGFLFALGAYNPLNWLLASLPGFSFFRVPARWMALEALGVAALAGAGLQSLKRARPHLWVLVLVVIVMFALAAASTLAGKQPIDVIGPAVPTLRSWFGWGVALLVLLLLLIVGVRWLGTQPTIALITVAAVIELFFASQIMPFNLVAPEDTYSASRFTIRQLQVYGADQTPPGRLLSISPLEFDPGDKDALNARYAALGMDALATRIALVATKLREVVGPNLGLRWGIPSIDGFDGGLLPTRYYSAFSRLLLPPESDPSTDGRLREMLALPECRGACIPDQRWLNLTNTRYLITDKTADVVQGDIFYDTSFELARETDQIITLHDFPDFEADAIDLLCRDVAGCFADVTFTYADGTSELLQDAKDFSVDIFTALRLKPITPRSPVSISLNPGGGSTRTIMRLSAVTLIDTRTGVFQQIALPPFKRVLSSDIKLYENTAVQPRAFIIHDFHAVDEDAGTALTWMRDPIFDPTRTATIVGSGLTSLPSGTVGEAHIMTYTPERVEIQAKTDAVAYLLLTDSYYPGWIATVNGAHVPILRADLMFRAVEIPAGESTVVFEYHPWWWPVVPIAGLALWLLLGLVSIVTLRRR